LSEVLDELFKSAKVQSIQFKSWFWNTKFFCDIVLVKAMAPLVSNVQF
jgi:hypothetical protein